MCSVSYVRPGDHIIARGSFCGECEQCLTGHANRCTDKPGRTPEDTSRVTLSGTRVHSSGSNIGSFAQQMLLPERGPLKIRTDMPLDAPSLINVALDPDAKRRPQQFGWLTR